jgi:hypothetical protein
MHSRTRLLIVSCALAILTLPLAAKDFVKPVAQPAKSYPAHDDHPDDKLAIAADPYDTPDKAKIFSVNFQEHGLLPIFLIITNDGPQPVSIANMQVTLTINHSKFTPVTTEDISRRLTNPQANVNPETNPLPFPIPRKKVKGTISKKEMDEIESSQFAAKAVEPHTTQSGFLFFDIADLPTPLAAAHLYINGVTDAKGAELMYFEIALRRELSEPQNAH